MRNQVSLGRSLASLAVHVSDLLDVPSSGVPSSSVLCCSHHAFLACLTTLRPSVGSTRLPRQNGRALRSQCYCFRQMPLVKKAKTEKDEASCVPLHSCRQDIESGQDLTFACLDANAKECLGWKSTDRTELKMLRSRRDFLPVDRNKILSCLRHKWRDKGIGAV